MKIESRLFTELYRHCNKVGYYHYDISEFHCIPLGITSTKSAMFIEDMLNWKKANWQSITEAYKLFGLFVNIQPEIFFDNSGELYIFYYQHENKGNYSGSSNWHCSCNLSMPDRYFFKDDFFFAILRRIASWTKKKYASGIKDYYNYCRPNTLTPTEYKCLYDYLKADDYLTVFNKYGESTYKEIIGEINPHMYENQFIRESISVIENELYKMFKKIYEEEKKDQGNRVFSQDEVDPLMDQCQNEFKKSYEIIHNIKCGYTF